VGLCQIGAAVMATRGFSAEQILNHYFRGVMIEKIY
jgi:stage II sporulation protein D